MPLVTLEEYCASHNLDSNYLYLMAAAGHLPHQRIFGKIYVDSQVLEKIQEEQDFWERQFGQDKS